MDIANLIDDTKDKLSNYWEFEPSNLQMAEYLGLTEKQVGEVTNLPNQYPL